MAKWSFPTLVLHALPPRLGGRPMARQVRALPEAATTTLHRLAHARPAAPRVGPRAPLSWARAGAPGAHPCPARGASSPPRPHVASAVEHPGACWTRGAAARGATAPPRRDHPRGRERPGPPPASEPGVAGCALDVGPVAAGAPGAPRALGGPGAHRAMAAGGGRGLETPAARVPGHGRGGLHRPQGALMPADTRSVPARRVSGLAALGPVGATT